MTDTRRLRTLSLVLVAGVWAVAWVVRRHYSSPNVDDYLYSGVALRLWVPLRQMELVAAIRAFLHTGQTAPLVPALGAPLARLGPDGVVLIQLPLLLLLTTFVFAITERVVGATAAFAAASLTALSAPVLSWSLMVHMALAASVCALGVLDCYLQSHGFGRRSASVRVGVWLGLLALSRSMAPVYLAAIGITVLYSVIRFHRATASHNWGNVFIRSRNGCSYRRPVVVV
jgi:hypothetical protein